MMKRNLIVLAALFVAVAFPWAAPARDGGRPSETGEMTTLGDQLHGAWVVVSVEIMGMKIDNRPQGGEQILTFEKDGKVTMRDGMRNENGSYKLNDSPRPKEMDLTTPQETMKGIYEVKGDTLRIAFPFNGPNGARPKTFDEKEVGVVTLKRKR
jgi:uncharacterized protein (TIGR03067 family)